MVFSAPIFLFGFLPLVLLAYFAAPARARNAVLLAASFVFYAWGERVVVLVLAGSIVANWALALGVDRWRGRPAGTACLAAAVGANLAVLVYWKYAGFLVDNLNVALAAVGVPGLLVAPAALPAGVSFFTFQGISYVVDVHRRDAEPARRPQQLALCIGMFAHLIAGPIVRWRDVAAAVVGRRTAVEDVAAGIRRFVVGLAKKVLVADTLASAADGAFAVPVARLSADVAWLGSVCYGLQLYFDFSGYSDMAIGLGRMFGFRFRENFAYPLAARSVTDFWRRWNMSLSAWFRDYLYVPLGGNRRGPGRTYRNLVLVFLLCGLWHGAAWTFVAWGAVHGALLVAERLGLGARLARAPAPLAHGYLLAAFFGSFVLFRAPTLAHGVGYLAAMAGGGAPPGPEYGWTLYWSAPVALALTAGAAGAAPVVPWLRARAAALPAGALREALAPVGAVALPMTLLAAALVVVASSTYQPFLYFRF